eukprot:GHVQ01004060.1.p1 GENE.GHVQ01004060.1~~GHVQ01004060.1.p1  ORF type:complete len:116 (-),score=4.12 GHVQ01004060.1:461-808(-)
MFPISGSRNCQHHCYLVYYGPTKAAHAFHHEGYFPATSAKADRVYPLLTQRFHLLRCVLLCSCLGGNPLLQFPSFHLVLFDARGSPECCPCVHWFPRLSWAEDRLNAFALVPLLE